MYSTLARAYKMCGVFHRQCCVVPSLLRGVPQEMVMLTGMVTNGSAVACAGVMPGATCAWLHGAYNGLCMGYQTVQRRVIDGRAVLMRPVILVYIRTLLRYSNRVS